MRKVFTSVLFYSIMLLLIVGSVRFYVSGLAWLTWSDFLTFVAGFGDIPIVIPSITLLDVSDAGLLTNLLNTLFSFINILGFIGNMLITAFYAIGYFFAWIFGF